MKRYLSVDCGGTKTAFLLCDENGVAKASCILGPANYMVNGIDACINILKEGIDYVCSADKISRGDITGTFIALAGFKDIPDDVPRITKMVEEAFPEMKITLGNDTENALGGSLLGKRGIHLIAGTGAIGLGHDENGDYIRSSGWHHLFGGDEGSGYWIGCRLIQHFTKQADGREEKTQLYDYVMEKYNLGCPENILELVINQWNGDRDKIASMSLDVYELAKKNDKVALSIFEEAGKELAMIVKSIYNQGDFQKPTLISYSGGVFKSFDFFRVSIEENLAEMEFQFVKPSLLPVAGGIILACENAGDIVAEEMLQNLKESQKF